MRRKMLPLLAALLAAAPLAALDNVFLVSDTVSFFEQAFGARAQVKAWFVTADGSTLNYGFEDKGSVVFHLTEPVPGSRYVDKVQVEPAPQRLTQAKGLAFAQYVAEDLARRGGMTCQKLREDKDGINAYLVHSCSEPKAGPGRLQMTSTIQSVGGRNLVFIQFAPEKR